MKLSFKEINSDDILALRQIGVDTFRETYQELNDPLEFEAYILSAFNEEKLLSEIENPQSHYYFVYHDQVLIGYFKINVGKAQTEEMTNHYAELERIYLYKKYHGKSFGAAMIRECESKSNKMGASKLWLGVWEKNLGAVEFYKKMGFKVFDTHFFVIGSDHQMDYMMEKEL